MLQAELLFEIGADRDAIGCDIPIEQGRARSGQSERAAFGITDLAFGKTPARECMLNHGEADQHHDEHKAADQGWCCGVVRQLARHHEAGSHDPRQQQEPSRDQHQGAIISMRRQIDDEKESERCDATNRDARHAGRNRRVEERKTDQRTEKQEPTNRDVA